MTDTRPSAGPFRSTIRTVVAISAIFIVLCGFVCSVQGNVDESNLESECRPYVEKALKDQLGRGDISAQQSAEAGDSGESAEGGDDGAPDQSQEQQADGSSTEAATPDQESANADVSDTHEILIDASEDKSGELDSQQETATTQDTSVETPSNENASQSEDDNASGSEEQTQDAQSSETIDQIPEVSSKEDDTAEKNESGEAETGISAESTEDKSGESPEDTADGDQSKESVETVETGAEEMAASQEQADEPEQADATAEDATAEETDKDGESDEVTSVEGVVEEDAKSGEDAFVVDDGPSQEETVAEDSTEQEVSADSKEGSNEGVPESVVVEDGSHEGTTDGSSEEVVAADGESKEGGSAENTQDHSAEEGQDSKERDHSTEVVQEEETVEEKIAADQAKVEGSQEATTEDSKEVTTEESQETPEGSQETAEGSQETAETETTVGEGDASSEGGDDDKSKEDTKEESAEEKTEEGAIGREAEAAGSEEAAIEVDKSQEAQTEGDAVDGEISEEGSDSAEGADENELIKEFLIPENLRARDTITELLHLDDESTENELALAKAADSTLRELKRLYDSAIKPLEILYKYRDLSNRHFGDPEIFSKPLILFMGPWSGGKSSIINYLIDNDYKESSLRTGAEPSPAYFNIVTWGPEPEILDGTQLAADWTFSGLQKFGQGLEDRLRGLKLPNKLLEMVNIVEIPGILEVRKQVSRVFPFNDACQWFIDRADIIFLVYDPSKLDVGPETEAILDQLKGREYQTRVILNKADTVKPEELLRVQGALIWNISPLMSSPQPPIIYTTSLWSIPYNQAAPVRLLQAQERAFLRDIRLAIDKRVENKIASARRFAVRVRNHAKMVDCYLTTYYNHKTFFGNRKIISDEIINHPQEFHIYEGLSTLKNISRYDLPDPDAYRDFFRVNPLYEFQPLSATCTYFKGCPINRLDVCIAYDLPELVGKHKKLVEQSVAKSTPNS